MKMLKLITFILLTISYISTANAEIVKRIEISGNSRVSEETIKIYGNIILNKDYSKKDLNKILTDLNSTNFFQEIEIDLTNGLLKIDLAEYPVINELIILGEDSKKYKEEIRKIIKSKEKDSFIEKNIARDIKSIKKIYSSTGYNFVKINTKVRERDKNKIDLVFDIQKGERSKIKKISFTGDKKIREKRLRDVIASEEDKFWKFISNNTNFNQSLINLDVRLLLNYYKSIGYYDVEITSSSAELKESGDVEVIYSIDAGNRYVIKKIITNPDSVFDKNIFYPLEKKYNTLVGSYYSPFKVKKLLENIDELIAKNNLQFVEHNVEEIIEDDSIVIKFNIYEGEKKLVERINILGNNVTNESVIRGELLLDEGDPFTELSLSKSISKIKSRNIFSSVKKTVSDGSESNLKIIDINVEEKPTGEISAGAGVGTNGGSIAFIVKENNWLGKGNNVSFDIDASQESLRGTLSYTNPNYDFLGNSLTYSLGSVSNDRPVQGYENTLISAAVGTTFEQYQDVYATLGLSASHDDLQTDDTASASLKKQSGTFSDLTADYGFAFDKRNRSFMPTEGSIISLNQSLPIYADRAYIANRLSASVYNEFSEKVVGAGKLFISTTHGLGDDDVRLSKRQNLSTKRLRGFKRGKVGPVDGSDHIGGNYAAAINLEANLPKLLADSMKTDVGLFLDFGNVWGVDYDGTVDESNEIRSSTGVAANWMSPLGPMSFVFSTNISKAATDKTESFNFNLGTTF